MPTAKGKAQVNIHLTDSVNQQLAILAGKEEFGSKSEVVEQAILRMIEGHSDTSLVVNMHDHIANMETRVMDCLNEFQVTMKTTIQELTQAVQKLQTDHDNLIERLNRFEHTSQKKHDSLLHAYDSLREGLTSQPTSLKRLFGMG